MLAGSSPATAAWARLQLGHQSLGCDHQSSCSLSNRQAVPPSTPSMGLPEMPTLLAQRWRGCILNRPRRTVGIWVLQELIPGHAALCVYAQGCPLTSQTSSS